MNRQRLYITVDGVEIAVDAGEAPVNAALEEHFQYMLTTRPQHVVAQLVAGTYDPSFAPAERHVTVNEQYPQAVVDQLESRLLLTLIRARPERLWLHAGGVAHQGKALVIPAPSTQGKSTLVTTLAKRGWLYLSDEYVPLEITTRQVIPFPRMPWKRQDPGRVLPLEQVLNLRRIRVPLAPSLVARVPTSVGAFLFPTYCRGVGAELRTHSLSGAALKLLTLVIHAPKPRRELLTELCRMLERVPCYDLVFGDAALAAELISAAVADWPVEVNYKKGEHHGC